MSKDWAAIVEHLKEIDTPGMLKVRVEVAERIWQNPDEVRFAVEVGFPAADRLFHVCDRVGVQNPAHPAGTLEQDPELVTEESPVGPLWHLGYLFTAFLYVRATDGTVWCSDPDYDEEYELLHADLSSLAYLLYVIAAERPTAQQRPTPYDWADAIDNVKETLNEWDPQPFADEDGFWERFLDQWSTLGERE